MKKTFIRSFFKNIVHSLSRLLSIICIVILGVGFLVGLLTSAPNVENSIDHYYDQYNVSDIDIMSTLGVDEKDKEFLLENIDEIENIKLESRNDMYVTYNNDTLVAKVIDYDFDSIINKIELKEGRLPENGDEIVVNISNNWLLNLQIGSKVTIDDHQYTIVGKVLDPNYFDKAKVTSSLGKGYLEAVIYRDAKYIDVEYYTDIFITIKGAEELDAFSSRYDDLISNVTTQIDNLKDEIKEYKFQAIRDEIYSSVYQAVYEETSKSVTSQAQAAAKEQITSLIQSQVESSVTSSIEKQITEEVTNSIKEQLIQQIKQSQPNLSDEEVEALAAQQMASDSITQAIASLVSQQMNSQETKDLIASTVETQMQSDDVLTTINSLYENQITSESFLSQVSTAIENAMKSDAVVKVINDTVDQQYSENVDEESFMLIVLDRQYYQAFRSIQENVNKINVIALIFPVFFFLVAALVVLTTMTRMVEEERLQIGTLKSLGYTRGAIMANYIGYGLFSSVFGGLLGVACGVYILPSIIYNIFNANYLLPPFVMTFSYPSILLSFFLMVIIILLTTVLTVGKTLKEKPADLMVKRAPKPGKKILLERIHFIWNHLKFKNKSALRNVFRYKKHMIMTIVGVAGCSALLVCGFGIKDSFDDMVINQYQDVLRYQLSASVADTNKDIEILTPYEKTSVAVESAYLNDKSDTRYDFSLVITSDLNELKSYVQLENVTYNTNSIIVSKQLSDKISEDKTFTLIDQGRNEYQLTYTDVMTNYLGNYVFMTLENYQKIFEKEITLNTFWVKISSLDNSLKEEISQALLEDENVTSYEFTSDTEQTYKNTFENIGTLVYFLILCSGALAIIVIYNLTNINIIERNKEIATLKVLGYKRIEVANYVYKETFILTTLGILVGLLVGFLLHQFIMFNIDSPGVMMYRGIRWYSYIYSILLSYLFLIIVDVLLYFKLEKIKMVESLKSVD